MADGRPRLSSEQLHQLIDLYQSHQPLWDIHHKQYKDKRIRGAMLRSITVAFQVTTGILLTVDDVKRKIHSFRTQFGKELRSIEKSKKNGNETADGVYTSTYEFFDALLFLQPMISPRPQARTNLDDSPSSCACSQSQNGQASPDVQDTVQDSHESSHAEACPNTSDQRNQPDAAAGHQADDDEEPVNESDSEEVMNESETEHANPSVNAKGQKRRKILKQSVSKKSKTDSTETDVLDYLQKYIARREQREVRRREEEEKKKEGESTVNSPTVFWVRSLAHEIDSLKSERRKRQLKMKINNIVHTAHLEELDEMENQ